MKRIIPNSYYASARTHNGGTYYNIYHYIDIWDNNAAWGNGFTVDNYTISPNDICFEGASWNGKIAIEHESYIPIPADLYNHWHNLIAETKERIVLMGKNSCRALQDKPCVGAYLFYHYTKEEDDEYDYDFSYFYKILEVNEGFYKIETLLTVDKYDLDCEHRIYIETEDYEIERIFDSQLVDESVINDVTQLTQELIAKLTKEIAAVIKSKTQNYENRY